MKSKCSVFVGNIDFDVTEKQIIEELSAVGKVVSFKLMIDKNTSRSKGFGFCEYESPLVAEKAIKHLNISFNNRPVIINYAEKDPSHETKEEEEVTLDIDNIISVLNNMDIDNLKEVLVYMKQLAIAQPTYFKSLLSKNSQLVYALIYSLKKLKLIDDNLYTETIKNSFNLNDNQIQIIDRIRTITDDEMQSFPKEVIDKIKIIRDSLMSGK